MVRNLPVVERTGSQLEQMEPAILQLPERRVRQAVDILVTAFRDDPVLTFFLNNPSRRTLAFRAFFANIVRAHLRFGHVYAAVLEDRVAGVAVWRPPGAGGETLRDRVRTLSAQLLVRSLFPRTAGDLFRGFAATIALHPRAPHWYLFFMGVDVDLRGRGIGSKLVAPVLDLADRTGTLCYLETPFPRTHAFYQRQGFEISSESHPFRGAPTLWTMTRHPNPREQ